MSNTKTYIFALLFMGTGCAILAVPAAFALHHIWLSFKAERPYTRGDMKHYDNLNPKALAALNRFCLKTGQRWTVVSAWRSAEENKDSGGASSSQHLYGNAFDLRVPHWQRDEFYRHAKAAGFRGFGWGASSVHIDIRPQREWWSYDSDGKHVGDPLKWQFVYKAPKSFQQEVAQIHRKPVTQTTLYQRYATVKWDLLMLYRDVATYILGG